MENNSIPPINYDSESELEALSLCDLPLGGDLQEEESLPTCQKTSQEEEAFEFFTSLQTSPYPSMRSAEDIIFCGKILPFRPPSPPSEDRGNRRYHRKSESLNDLQRSNSHSTSSKYMMSSRSLDYKKLHRDSSTKMMRTNSISKAKCFGCDSALGRVSESASSATPVKPKWRLLMFGVMNTPREMELKDIKSRQSRLNPSTFFPPSAEPKRDEGKGSWKLLRALSCKGQANGVITASLFTV